MVEISAKRKRIVNIIVAHIVASYIAYVTFMSVVIWVNGLSFAKEQWLSILSFGLLAPITVPAFMVLSIRQPNPHLDRPSEMFALWACYILCGAIVILMRGKK
jgi:hypothetical protein